MDRFKNKVAVIEGGNGGISLSIKLVFIFVILILNVAGQDTSMAKINKLELAFGTFNTINESNKVTINPTISGYLGDYYFENRCNYETNNSASINLGKKIFKKLKHTEIVPMVGLVFVGFKGVTAELQTSLDYNKWTFSTDNQYSFEYTQPDKSLFFNWTVARCKLANSFQIGITTFLDKRVNHDIIFDKGVTAVILFKKWSWRFYAFNYEKEKRYYWIGIRYNIRVK
jgi:hypothetical protein